MNLDEVVCEVPESGSKKHLHRYVDEFTFRLNEGNVRNHTTARLNSFVAGCVGKRLTYNRLIT
jgi:hypothetical protein